MKRNFYITQMRKWLSILFTMALFCCTTKEIEFYTAEEREQIMNAGFSSSSAVSSSSSEALSSGSESSSDSSSSEADGSSSSENVSSSSAPSVPEPLIEGSLYFVNPDYEKDGVKYYYLGATPSVDDDLFIVNYNAAKCAESIIKTPTVWNTSESGPISVCAKISCNDDSKTLQCAYAEVVPPPSLDCAWSKPVLTPGEIAEEIELFSVKDNYGRCEEFFLSIDGVEPWVPPASWKAEEANLATKLKVHARCGSEVMDKSCPVKVKNPKATVSYIVDSRDWQVYQTVQINNLTWMAENLNYSDGGKIGFCYGENASQITNHVNCDIYGRLYDWRTAMDLHKVVGTDYNITLFGTQCGGEANCYNPPFPPHQGICPEGWRLPTKADWDTLKIYTASQLKAASHWDSGGHGSDILGFAALPGGYYYVNDFGDIGRFGNWWSATEYNAYDAYNLNIAYNTAVLDMPNNDKGYMLSVRCVKDL